MDILSTAIVARMNFEFGQPIVDAEKSYGKHLHLLKLNRHFCMECRYVDVGMFLHKALFLVRGSRM